MTDTGYRLYASVIKARKNLPQSTVVTFNVWVHEQKSLEAARIYALDEARRQWPQDEDYYDYDEVTVEVITPLLATIYPHPQGDGDAADTGE